MKNVVLIGSLCLTMLFGAPLKGGAQDIAVIKSADVKPYNDAISGFKTLCSAGISEFRLEDLDDAWFNDNLNNRPDLVFAVGLGALSAAKRIRNVPVVFAMVSNPRSVLSGERNITGVSMNVSAKRQLASLLDLVPVTKKVGVVYDPANTSILFKEAQGAAASLGVALISREVHDPKEAPSAIREMKDEIDAFWMLPDTTVLTEETLEYLLLLSFENRLPVLAFSERFVDMGALLALSIDAVDIGKQACEMAKSILAGKDARDIPLRQPRKADLSIKLKTADHLGIDVKERLTKKENAGGGILR